MIISTPYFMRFAQFITIICCVYSLLLLHSMIANSQELSQQEQKFPQFRHIDTTLDVEFPSPATPVRLLVDLEFAPFGFTSSSGMASGISVDLGLAACGELRWSCQLVSVPFSDLLPALVRGDGDVIISGLKLNENIATRAHMTKPYFWSMGRFATRIGGALENPDVKTLAGRRVGFVQATTHAQFLEKYYSRSALTPFASEQEMFEALRTGQLDTVFGDNLRVSYWLSGSAARACCEPLGGAMVDRESFSRKLSFLMRPEQANLRIAFDYALDRLQENGKSTEIFLRYVSANIW